MSFIRKKFNLVRDRSSDEGNRSSQEVQRTSISSEDTGYPSKAVPSLSGSINEGSTGRLHKVASTTFKAFSDTIRAKAQMFYTNAGNPEITGPDSPEIKTPRKHGYRPSVWPSARSRQGLADCTNRTGTANSPDTPIVQRLEEPSPALNIIIPNPSLTDLRIATENEIPMKHCCAPKQLWPTPARIACPQSPPADGSLGTTTLPLRDDPYTESPYADKDDPSRSISHRTASPTSRHCGKDDAGYVSDVESLADLTEPDGFSPASTKSPSYVTPRTATVVKCLHGGQSLFVKGDQARVHFQRTPSPFQKAKQSQESPPADATMLGSERGSTLESPLTLIRSDSSAQILPKEPTETTDRVILPDSPSAHGSHSSGNIPVGCRPDPSATEIVKRAGYGRLLSHMYEADTESAAPIPGTPNMGSRDAWNETRADRSDRYIAIHTISETTYSGEDSESELKLTRSPSRKQIHPTEEEGGIGLSEREQAISSGYAEVRKQESRNPSNASLQKKLEALELLESSCEASSDTESQIPSPPQSENPLRFYVEANNKTSGIILDELEADLENILDIAFPGLDTRVFEFPSSAEDEVLQTVLSASSSDEGRQSCEDIQKVQNVLMNDDEYRDVIQRSNMLQQLVAARMLRLSERPEHKRRWEMSKAREDDALADSVEKSQTPLFASKHRQEADLNSPVGVSSFPDENLASQCYLDADFVGDNEILDITVMDGEISRSYNIAKEMYGSPPLEKLQPSGRRAFTNALRNAGISRRSLEEGTVFIGNPPNTPIEYPRSVSTDSVRTTESCAITTSSPLCFVPSPFPTLHVRSSPVRSTSSILAGYRSHNDEDDEDSSSHSLTDGRASTPDEFDDMVRARLGLESASSPFEPRVTSTSSIPATLNPPIAAGSRAQSTLKEFSESPESLRLFEHSASHTSPRPASPAQLPVLSSKTNRRTEQTLPFRLKEDQTTELPTEGSSEPSPKKVRLDNSPQVLGKTTGNNGKKKRRRCQNRKSKISDSSSVQEPVKSPPAATSPRSLGKALGSMGLDVDPLAKASKTTPPIGLSASRKEGGLITSSNEKGIWWARNRDREFGGSPLAGKKRRGDGYEDVRDENHGVGIEEEDA